MKTCIWTIAAACVPLLANGAESVCYGSVGNGRIENSVALPASGANFTAYSSLGVSLGRTHVHSKVSSIVLASYEALAVSAPGNRFVFGETGWPSGGRLRPHRTHQNGLSVDFFVPVRNSKGQSVALPTSLTNKWGYNIEFDRDAKFGEFAIDFEAMAEHLYQLDIAAKAAGTSLARVIFDVPYLSILFKTKRGEYLKANLPFMKGKPWIRHDEHYHVDFGVSCKSNAT